MVSEKVVESGMRGTGFLFATDSSAVGILEPTCRGAWTDQCHRLDDIAGVLCLHLDQQGPHSRTLQLEAAEGAPFPDQIGGLGALFGNAVDIEGFTTPFLDQITDGTQLGDAAIAEKIDLDQSGVLDGVHVQLGDGDATVGALQADDLGDGAIGDTDTTRVDRAVVGAPPQPFGVFEESSFRFR